jgi:hypothetical protein
MWQFGPVGPSYTNPEGAWFGFDPFGKGWKVGPLMRTYPKGGGGGGGDGCFVAGTKIAMGDGTEKNIEDVEVGDIVKSINENYDGVTESSVIELLIHTKPEKYLIINEHLKVTGGHPIWIPNRIDKVSGKIDGQWIWAREIARRNNFLHLDGSEVPMETIIESDDEVTTYNLELDDDGTHTYFANGYLVHNGRGGPGDTVYRVIGGGRGGPKGGPKGKGGVSNEPLPFNDPMTGPSPTMLAAAEDEPKVDPGILAGEEFAALTDVAEEKPIEETNVGAEQALYNTAMEVQSSVAEHLVGEFEQMSLDDNMNETLASIGNDNMTGPYMGDEENSYGRDAQGNILPGEANI